MYKHLQWKTFLVISLFLLVSCQSSLPSPTPVAVSTFTDPDPELTVAVRHAQDTLYILREAFLAPKQSYAFMSVKVRFISNKGIEDMWTEPVDLVDNLYTVRMVEGVTIETGAHPDRLIIVSPDRIIDWMIKEKDGTVLGGYTLRLEYERMTPEEQKKYLEVTGYVFK